MTEYGQAFYGSDEIHEILGRQLGKWTFEINQDWLEHNKVTFIHSNKLYKLPKNHWFYDSDEFERAIKPDDEIAKPLADYSDDELKAEMDAVKAEIERRQSQDDEITILARKLCADNYRYSSSKTDFIAGNRDDKRIMHIVKAAIIADMELQKGREA